MKKDYRICKSPFFNSSWNGTRNDDQYLLKLLDVFLTGNIGWTDSIDNTWTHFPILTSPKERQEVL